jgi:hypothetical protein
MGSRLRFQYRPSLPPGPGLAGGCSWFQESNQQLYTTSLIEQIEKLRTLERPLICTEYMARARESRFETHLPVFKHERVGCYNWGLVKGKTQTNYPWDPKTGAPSQTSGFMTSFGRMERPSAKKK